MGRIYTATQIKYEINELVHKCILLEENNCT
jgi:hypothetical protein